MARSMLRALALVVALCGCVRPPHARDVPTVRVMTYNIRSGNGALDGTAAEIRSHAPDVVALQEVDVHWDARSNFLDEATLLGEKLGMHVCFAPIYRIPSATPGAPMREFGVALLTKLPLLSCDNRVIARLSTQEANPAPVPMPGFLDAVVEIAGRSVHVYDTHLDYRGDPSVRRLQVADMLAYLGDSATPMILMGDLNAEPGAPELAPLFARLHDAWSVNGGPGLTYPAESPKKRIDYVLVSDDFRAVEATVQVTQASDHLPVVVDLVLVPARNDRRAIDESDSDAALFAAVVKAVKRDEPRVPLEIDPRPLRADPEIAEPSERARASVSAEMVQRRRDVLRRLGISSTDNATNRGCAGVTTPPPLPGQVEPKAKCPNTPISLAAIGLPRSGGAYLPPGYIDERAAGKRAGQVAVRVLLTDLAPSGAVTTAYDYIFERKTDKWSYVKRVALNWEE